MSLSQIIGIVGGVALLAFVIFAFRQGWKVKEPPINPPQNPPGAGLT
jgi:O-antigen ligase